MAKFSLDRQLSSGHHIRATLESLDIPTHSLVTALHSNKDSVHLALTNVLDVAEAEIAKLQLESPEPRSAAVLPAPGVGGACGEDPERISNR